MAVTLLAFAVRFLIYATMQVRETTEVTLNIIALE